MSSVNKAIIIGNLGRDPEMRTFPDGTASCSTVTSAGSTRASSSRARRMWPAEVTSRMEVKLCMATQRAVSSALDRVSMAS